MMRRHLRWPCRSQGSGVVDAGSGFELDFVAAVEGANFPHPVEKERKKDECV